MSAASRANVSPPKESLAGTSEGKQNGTNETRVPPGNLAHVDAPSDITATELFDVATEALRRCGLWPRNLDPSQRTRAQTLGLLATFVTVMRDRGWTVLPPGHHRPIDPR